MLVSQRRRMVCGNCDSRFLEDHPTLEGALTARLTRRLVVDAKVMTVQAATRRYGVGWHNVDDSVRAWAWIVASGATAAAAAIRRCPRRGRTASIDS